MAEKKKVTTSAGARLPPKPVPDKACCKKLEKIQSLLTNVPVYLPPDKLKEVRKVLEAPMSDYE